MVHLDKWFLQLTHRMSLKTTLVKFLPHLPGASELTADLKQLANKWDDLRLSVWNLAKENINK